MATSTFSRRKCRAGRRGFERMGRESGAIAIMLAGALIMMCAFCGLALELSQVYNRRMELQTVADTAAVAAAYELDGTAAGITRAGQKASARFTASPPSQLTYQYGKQTMAWTDTAIEFGTSPNGPWVPYASAVAKASPNGLLYVKVDTGNLDTTYGAVDTMLMRVVSTSLATVNVSARAVAGRVGIGVTPLGICTMRPEASRNRSGELEEYGFRRGVAYDLMQLNSQGTSAGLTYLINPLSGPGAGGAATSDIATVAPFVCTGTLGIARVTGGALSVSTPFPLSDLYLHLNSRFDSYSTAVTAPCTPDSAPPDTNVKAYTANTITWMAAAPSGQAAALSTVDGKRWTVAGPDPTPSGTTAGQFGVLWSYAKAVNYAASPPSGGYTTFSTTNWNTLYNPGRPTASSYPSSPPYFKTGYITSPTHPGVGGRRVLNVPLLSCPVSGNSATVSAIGRFFMTVPADSDHLYAEFAGLADEQTLRTQVKLFP
ncbi:pilus assembly protein TadG-related protein [Telluria mixta]|uniref:Pilus assembly protein TadG-related protein n=1 Tax=Telluria mixta TaxID=34071 RepID=A0ABT2BZB9_9BURK|nr:pilus assembly protein TadG-related protein [Telluria mixta]MCS0630493.1 pilus assembly protein TadG-related protein [Telluria mixta]WEM94203.1 pilus assembly protein TadG-related protein [Telluria mixta]